MDVLNRLQDELIEILDSPNISPNEINPIGEINQSKFKLAIISGENNKFNNRLNVTFLVGVSVDTYGELLENITLVIYKFKGRRLIVSGVNDYIEFSTDKGFQIYTPESGKWIADLTFNVDLVYNFDYHTGNQTDYMFGENLQIESVNYGYK